MEWSRRTMLSGLLTVSTLAASGCKLRCARELDAELLGRLRSYAEFVEVIDGFAELAQDLVRARSRIAGIENQEARRVLTLLFDGHENAAIERLQQRNPKLARRVKIAANLISGNLVGAAIELAKEFAVVQRALETIATLRTLPTSLERAITEKDSAEVTNLSNKGKDALDRVAGGLTKLNEFSIELWQEFTIHSLIAAVTDHSEAEVRHELEALIRQLELDAATLGNAAERCAA